jgi:hypothetical protein
MDAFLRLVAFVILAPPLVWVIVYLAWSCGAPSPTETKFTDGTRYATTAALLAALLISAKLLLG